MWSTIKPVLIAAFTRCAIMKQITSPGGVHEPLKTPAFEAEWKERARKAINPLYNFALYIQITSCVGVGGDDLSYAEQDTGIAAGEAASNVTDVFETLSGLRRFVLQVQAHSLENTDALDGHTIIERIRTRLDGSGPRAMLLDANIDFTDVGASRDMTMTKDGKRWSVVSCDFTFTAAINETDPIPVGWIEQVIMTSHEQNAGIDVQASLRMIEETLPPDEP